MATTQDVVAYETLGDTKADLTKVLQAASVLLAAYGLASHIEVGEASLISVYTVTEGPLFWQMACGPVLQIVQHILEADYRSIIDMQNPGYVIMKITRRQ